LLNRYRVATVFLEILPDGRIRDHLRPGEEFFIFNLHAGTNVNQEFVIVYNHFEETFFSLTNIRL